jgi:quinol-cytochrome oxidoreductase complex cytochrome b subunit
MNGPKFNYSIDVLMALSFIITSISGLILFFFLPEGLGRGNSTDFLGIVRRDWKLIHDWSGIALAVLVLIHLVLHWKWIVCMTKNLLTKKNKDKC